MPPPPEAAVAARDIVPPFDPSERCALFAVAREAIAAQLEGRKPKLPPPPQRLTEPRGAFVTLHLGGELRGCVGFVVAILPLHRTVAEAAVGAAFHDFRFPPLTTPEFREVTLELSVLSPVERVRPEEVMVGRHGLLISQGSRRGLLLPQVAEEHGWDAPTFLARTCLKAGLSPDAWLNGATVEAFTAEIFSE
jgi:AmmeMemoRadiSam system protein A